MIYRHNYWHILNYHFLKKKFRSQKTIFVVWFVYLTKLSLKLLQILFVEFSLRNNEQSRYSLWGTNIPNWVYCSYNNLLWFLFGAACSQLTTDIGKYTIGRLRPHFMDICKPNVDCNNDQMKNIYIEDFECSGNKEHKFTDSRLSFPSGHSSLSFYCMIYIAVS